MVENGNIVQIDKNKEREERIKPLWAEDFDKIPNVLTIDDIAEFLRVPTDTVLQLIGKKNIEPLPGTNEIRIFKGYLFSYLTQTPPKKLGLSGGEDNPGVRQDQGIGF